jgi:hypothetical protein
MDDRELIALALKHGHESSDKWDNTTFVFNKPKLLAFCAALKADERGSAEPEFIAAYMASCSGRDADHNEIGLHYFRAGWNARHPDSAQARDAAQAVELTDAEIHFLGREAGLLFTRKENLGFGRAIERAVLAKNGLRGKQ